VVGHQEPSSCALLLTRSPFDVDKLLCPLDWKRSRHNNDKGFIHTLLPPPRTCIQHSNKWNITYTLMRTGTKVLSHPNYARPMAILLPPQGPCPLFPLARHCYQSTLFFRVLELVGKRPKGPKDHRAGLRQLIHTPFNTQTNKLGGTKQSQERRARTLLPLPEERWY